MLFILLLDTFKHVTDVIFVNSPANLVILPSVMDIEVNCLYLGSDRSNDSIVALRTWSARILLEPFRPETYEIIYDELYVE